MIRIFISFLIMGSLLLQPVFSSNQSDRQPNKRELFERVRKQIAESAERNDQWRADMEELRRIAGPQDAKEILGLWKQTRDHNAAYDLAWILGNLRAIEELASQLDDPETWRREQVALILYGHSERLNLDQAGKILRTHQLCRFQQLWLITRVVRNAHPSPQEVADFLARYEVIPSPELLYELRTLDSEWIAAQVRGLLANGEATDRERLISMLPDFALPDRIALAEARLLDSEGAVRA